MRIEKIESDMKLKFKFFGKKKELTELFNLTFRNYIFTLNSAGMYNKPDENGNNWFSYTIYKWNDKKAYKIIEDCTGIKPEQMKYVDGWEKFSEKETD